MLGLFLAASLVIHLVATGLGALSELLNAKTLQHMAFNLRTQVHDKLAGADRLPLTMSLWISRLEPRPAWSAQPGAARVH